MPEILVTIWRNKTKKVVEQDLAFDNGQDERTLLHAGQSAEHGRRHFQPSILDHAMLIKATSQDYE